MKNLLTTDWIELLFRKGSLALYEREQEKHRKINQTEKSRILKNNRIIVKVNNDTIYDSKKQTDMSDELYYALLSYGLMNVIKSKGRNNKQPINLNLFSSISSIPVAPDDLFAESIRG